MSFQDLSRQVIFPDTYFKEMTIKTDQAALTKQQRSDLGGRRILKIV